MKIELNYFIIQKEKFISLFSEEDFKVFEIFMKEHCEMIRLPWGEIIYELEGFVVEQEDFELQEQVFTVCDLNMQNLFFKLKEHQKTEDKSDKYSLAFSYY